MEIVRINLKSYPNHKIEVFDDRRLVQQFKVVDGWKVVDELIDNEDVFEDIAMKKWLKACKDNFEIEGIEIGSN